jgi:hypothetical protein
VGSAMVKPPGVHALRHDTAIRSRIFVVGGGEMEGARLELVGCVWGVLGACPLAPAAGGARPPPRGGGGRPRPPPHSRRPAPPNKPHPPPPQNHPTMVANKNPHPGDRIPKPNHP